MTRTCDIDLYRPLISSPGRAIGRVCVCACVCVCVSVCVDTRVYGISGCTFVVFIVHDFYVFCMPLYFAVLPYWRSNK